jgi:hypothetical protein
MKKKLLNYISMLLINSKNSKKQSFLLVLENRSLTGGLQAMRNEKWKFEFNKICKRWEQSRIEKSFGTKNEITQNLNP